MSGEISSSNFNFLTNINSQSSRAFLTESISRSIEYGKGEVENAKLENHAVLHVLRSQADFLTAIQERSSEDMSNPLMLGGMSRGFNDDVSLDLEYVKAAGKDGYLALIARVREITGVAKSNSAEIGRKAYTSSSVIDQFSDEMEIGAKQMTTEERSEATKELSIFLDSLEAKVATTDFASL